MRISIATKDIYNDWINDLISVNLMTREKCCSHLVKSILLQMLCKEQMKNREEEEKK